MKFRKAKIEFKFILTLCVLVAIYSCRSKSVNWSSENCEVTYENKRPAISFDYDPMYGQTLEEFTDAISKEDSIYVTFLATFLNDTVYIYKNEELITATIITSNMSIAYAKSIRLCKSTFENSDLILKINNEIVCPIVIDNEYFSIHVNYDKLKHKVHVRFTNDFLFLS